MRCAVIFADGIKQILFTPENDEERFALKLITANDDISLKIKHGSFTDRNNFVPAGFTINECQGGYLRMYESADSVMLVLRPKEATQ